MRGLRAGGRRLAARRLYLPGLQRAQGVPPRQARGPYPWPRWGIVVGMLIELTPEEWAEKRSRDMIERWRNVTESLCRGCNLVKPIEEFGRLKSGRPGTECRKCSSARRCKYGRANTARRRARKRDLDNEKIDVDAIKLRDKMICHICNRKVGEGAPFHLDHVIPLSKGGPTTMANLKLAHPRCNLSKRDRINP